MASVLETFYFLFKSNADDVDKGNAKAKKSADQLDESIKETGDSSKETSKAVVEMAGALGKAIGGFLAFSAIQAQFQQSITLTEELRLSSMAINENIEDIDAWGRASRRFGGDAQTLQGTLKTLNNNIREAAFTGEGAMSPALRRLGINLRTANGDIKTTLELLPEVATAFERISQPEALFLGEQLGLDQATILLLKSGRQNLDALIKSQKEYGVVTKQDAELSKKFKEQVSDTSNLFQAIRQRIVSDAMPGLISFYEGLENIGEWLVDNKTLVEGFFIATGVAIATYFVPAMISAAAATIAATWPLLAIGAIVAAVISGFALLYDEVVAFSNGQNSLIGEAAKRWPVLGFILEVLIERFKDFIQVVTFLKDILIAAFTEPEKVIEMLGLSIDNFDKRIKAVIDSFKFLGAILEPLLDPITFLSELFSGKDLSATVTGNLDKVKDSFKIAQNSIADATGLPIAFQNSNSIMSSAVNRGGDKNIQIDNITVETQATDAQGVSNSIGTSLRDSLTSMLYGFDDGISS